MELVLLGEITGPLRPLSLIVSSGAIAASVAESHFQLQRINNSRALMTDTGAHVGAGPTEEVRCIRKRMPLRGQNY